MIKKEPTMPMITISVILCAVGTIYGIYVLIRDLRITKKDISTQAKYALPILLGTLAWASATYTFYTMGIDSKVDAARVSMLLSWCIMASQYRGKYKPCKWSKKDEI